jgi:flagellar motor switch protein FliG
VERDKVAALRRVAIVLSSLPDATARRLLASLEPDHQRAVRAAINHLDDVDPLERRRALDGFTHSIRHGRSSLAGQNDAAEIVLSRVALNRDDASLLNRSQGNSPSDSDSRSGDSSTFGFLASIDDDAIALRIKDEHPQTIAIVLAAVSPRKAARLLAKLGVALRTETMRRLAKMDVPPTEVVEEIAAQLKQKLVHVTGNGVDSSSHATDSVAGNLRSPGQAALQAILAEMNNTHEHSLNGTQATDNGYSSVGATYMSGGYNTAVASGAAAVGTGDEIGMRRAGTGTEPATANDHRLDSEHDLVETIGRPAKSTAEVHSQLISTPPSQLREALASVDGRQAILALCGLPKATAEAVLNDLPRRQAKQIRQQIASFGMVELREIDAAKAAVANAIGLAVNRSLAPRNPRPMATSSATLAAA